MDIRGLRTKQAIEEAFLSLLREKAAARITVTEICKRSGINRATFYKHYLDIPDLHASMEEEVLADFQRVFRLNTLKNGSHRPVLEETLRYMKDSGSRFALLCSGNAGSELPARVFQLTQEHVFPLMLERLPDQDARKTGLLYRFLTRGCGALLVSWLREDNPMTVEEMTDFILQICSAAVNSVSDSTKEC